jgi:DNA polymerase-3 subunit delta'
MENLTDQILNSSVPTRLVVGDLELTRAAVEKSLQTKFCLHNNSEPVRTTLRQAPDYAKASTGSQGERVSPQSCFCSECRKIKNRQHPFLLWLCPAKDYSVDDIEIIFDKTRFALDDGEKFFFVLDKAQNLNSASANKILKVLEEPPAGYEFILLTDNKNLILPTILSRSFIIQLQSQNNQDLDHALLQYFCRQGGLPDPAVFDQELKKMQLSENESIDLAYSLLEFFIKKISTLYKDHFGDMQLDFYNRGLEILRKRLKTPPASGSSGFFWKLLYLDFTML